MQPSVKKGDNRIKQHSSMNYNEFVKAYDRVPKIEKIRPIKDNVGLRGLEGFSLEGNRQHSYTTPENMNSGFNRNKEYSIMEEEYDFDESTEGNVDCNDTDEIGGIQSSLTIKNKFNPLLNQQLQKQKEQQQQQQTQKQVHQSNQQQNELRYRSQSDKMGTIFNQLDKKIEKKRQTVNDVHNNIQL
ncbi:hypothetical protein PPERSA_12180 [Pseudocohnilembus persalinus]|uniref:Uncharacterized protein n=1 Tax=Pseudocohnilembus persalinus TaxID=266149 RepID=A0A0V0R8Y2_PSEPJ|nr:hypothetical protein PPERSA_12180 [Pseudocohnilembus persalinus]|eukprot:KRX10898.1 hypothetical protein PPERSA_12180 [Pseudocohnilembus persalinus]